MEKLQFVEAVLPVINLAVTGFVWLFSRGVASRRAERLASLDDDLRSTMNHLAAEQLRSSPKRTRRA